MDKKALAELEFLKKQVEVLSAQNKELEEKLKENNTLEQMQAGKLYTLYHKVTGQSPIPGFSVINYAIAIYEYLDNIISLAPGHIFWLDRNNIYLGCNDEQARNAGLYSRESIIGKTNYDLLWKEQAKALNAINNKVMESGKAIIIEEPVKTIEGDRTYLSQKVPLKNLYV